MKPTAEILASISQNSSSHPKEVFTKLYRYMLRPDIYFLAYKHLYANNGAATPGVDKDDTADGFSEAKVARIIESLKDGSYQPRPVRRTYIDKGNGGGKKRALGLPGFTDKLVQEVLRMILEAVYEPVFSTQSHGFRPGRSCHTALKDIKHGFPGVRWFIEGDIKGCFDNIDHNVLVSIIGRKIRDARLSQLIWKFLRAGYMENWKYNATYSGTPQGGIVSPILANIYLNELDRHVEELQKVFEAPSKVYLTHEYTLAASRLGKLRAKINRAQGEERDRLIAKHRELRKALLKIPAKSHTDKRICYVRYADDFLIGVCGNKRECEQIKANLQDFIATTLRMELSEEKTLITHSNQYARFLGYDVRVRRDGTVKRLPGLSPRRTLSNKVELSIPLQEKIETFLFTKGVVEQRGGKLVPIWRKSLTRLSPLEIVDTYNAELRGICNYYCMASNYASLNYFSYLMEYSCLKTLSAKARRSLRKTLAAYKDGHGKWGIPYETKTGKKCMYFANWQKCRKEASACNDTINDVFMMHNHNRNSLEARLKARVCELCGTTQGELFELHHVRKVKDLNGKERWEQCMIAKRRKTLVVCKPCHNAIHHGSKSQ